MAGEQEILKKLIQLSGQQQSVRPTLPGRAAFAQQPTLAERLATTTTQSGLSKDVRKAQSKLTSYTKNKSTEFPTLAERLQEIRSGATEQPGALGSVGSAVLNNPITKTALGALSIIDIPRRGVISGVRELLDILDTDKNTKASFGDWFNQTSDTTYGFGTAFPMEGALGRVIGFVGDVALDPLTYATLGSTVVKKAVVAGAFDAFGKPLTTRAALGGVKNVAGREGATALAGLTKRMGGSDALVQAVARDGKRAFRRLDAGYGDEGVKFAKRIGLSENGIYYLGSRVKVPFSGPIANMLESGLVGARLGVLKNVPGAARIQEAITPRGTAANKSLKASRAALRRGDPSISAEKASLLVQTEAMHFAERANTNMAADVYAKNVQRMMGDPDVVNAGPDIYKFLDTPAVAADGTPNWPRPMTPAEQLAYDKYVPFWKQLHTDVENSIRMVEPNFVLGQQKDFFPHVRTEAAERLAEDVNARGEQIRQYLKYDPTDPAGSFRSRQLKVKSEWFGHELTQSDIDKGVDRLNYLAKNPKIVNGVPVVEGMTENFFETDVMSVLKKYGDHYSSQIGMAHSMQKGIELNVFQRGVIGAEVTDNYLDVVDKAVKSKMKNVVSTGEKTRVALTEAINNVQQELEKFAVLTPSGKGTVGRLPDMFENLTAVANQTKPIEDTVNNLRKQVEKLVVARSERQAAVDAFNEMFVDRNVVIDNLVLESKSVDNELLKTISTIQDLISGIEVRNVRGPRNANEVGTVLFEGKERTINSTLNMLERRVKTLSQKMNSYDSSLAHADQMADTVELILGSNIDGMVTTGDNLFDRLITIATDPKSRLGLIPGSVRSSTGRGGLTETFMTNIFKDGERFAEFSRIVKIANSGDSATMSPRRLSKIFLEDYTDKDGTFVRGIKNRIYNGVTLGQNQEELRQTALWLIARDNKIASNAGRDFAIDLINDAPTRARYENLIAMMEEADTVARVESLRAEVTRTGVKIGTKEKPAGPKDIARASADARTKRYISLKQEIDDNAKAITAMYDLPTTQRWSHYSIDNAVLSEIETKQNKLIEEMKSIGKSLPKPEKNYVDRIGQTGNILEQNLRLADAVSEYYVHRQTSILVGRTAELLSLSGFEVTPQMYKTILSRVTADEKVGLGKFLSRFTEAETLMREIKSVVDLSDSKSISLKQELSKLFREIDPPSSTANAAELEAHRIASDRQRLIREFFPEIEAIWGKARGARTTRQFYSDQRSEQLIEDALQIAKELGVYQEYSRGLTRSAHPVTTPSGPVFDTLGNPIDYAELQGMNISSSSTYQQGGVIDSYQGNFQKLLNFIEGKEDIRVSKNKLASKGKKQISIEADLKAARLKAKKEYEFAIEEIISYFDGIRIQETSGGPFVATREQTVSRKEFLNVAEGVYNEKLRVANLATTEPRQSVSGSVSGQELGDVLSQRIGSMAPELDSFTSGATGSSGELNKLMQRSSKVKNIRKRYDNIISDIERARTVQQAAAKRSERVAAVPSKSVGLKGVVGMGEHYGFPAIVSDAINGGNRSVDDFFSEMLGGAKTSIDPDQPVGIKSGGKVMERPKRTFKEIPVSQSYFGKTKNRVTQRLNSLAVLSDDPAVSAEALLAGRAGSYDFSGRWISGSWAYNADLNGSSALADSLDEKAAELIGVASTLERRQINAGKKAALKSLYEDPNIVPPNEPTLSAIRSQTSDRLVELNARRANIRSAAKAAKLKIQPSINRLKKLQSQPMNARAVRHLGEQEFAMELANYSASSARASGLFTPLEWLSLWNDGIYKLTPTDEYALGNVRSYISNQIEILRKERAVAFKQGRKVREFDQKIAAFERGLNGEFNLDDFKADAYEKFDELYNRVSSSKAGSKKELERIMKSLTDQGPDSSPDAMYYIKDNRLLRIFETDTVVSVRKDGLRKRFESSPEFYHLQKVEAEKANISESMIQEMMRQPDASARQSVATKYARTKTTAPFGERAAKLSDEQIREAARTGEKIPKYTSLEAQNIYKEAMDLKSQGERLRASRISELEEQIGISDRRVMETSDEIEYLQNQINELLVQGSVKPTGKTSLQIAAQAEKTSAGLRPPASTYEGIDGITERNIRRKIITELGFEPGQFKGRTEQEIKNFIRGNKRIQKLIRQKQVSAKSSDLENLFNRRVKEEVAVVRDSRPALGPRNFRVNEELRSQVVAGRSAVVAAGEAKMTELRNSIIKLEWSGKYQEYTEFNALSDLFLKQGLDIETNLSKDLAVAQIRLGLELVRAQDELFDGKNLKSAFKKIGKADAKLAKIEQAVADAQTAYETSLDFDAWGPKDISQIELNILRVKNLTKAFDKTKKDIRPLFESDKTKKAIKANLDNSWMAEAESFIEEGRYMLNQLSGGKETPLALRRVVAKYLEQKSLYLEANIGLDVAQQEALAASWMKGLTPQQIAGMPGQPFAPSQVQMLVSFDDGFVELSKFYPTIGVRKEVADIFQNVHRVGDPVIAEQFQKYVGRYTRFFKAYATLSPGFHVRNAISNAFMLFAAGGNPATMMKGLDFSRQWIEASKSNLDVNQWIKTLPSAEQEVVRGAVEAAAASGGGMINDFLSEVTPFGTKFMKEKGRWIEQHSRFVLAYDGVASGMTPQQASARVKRYLIDYQDISTVDSVMRQIVPFWMWTSRNFPMQLQNMWTNPRSYQIYNSIKRNMTEDKNEGDIVPEWMVKAGAFKLPFGTDLYATPDLGFNRLQQQAEEFVNPSKYFGNVNPLLRVPLEVMMNRKSFTGQSFSDNPVQVGGGSSKVIQPLLQMLGYGQTNSEGNKFVSEKAYYALTSLIPTLGQAERLVPSKSDVTGAQRLNALYGYIGLPVKQNTERNMLSELARRKTLAQKVVSKQRTLEGE